MQRDDPALSLLRAADASRFEAGRPSAPTWALGDCYGPLGDYVRLVAPHTEAAPVAVYALGLAALGALIGRGPRWHFGNVNHHVCIFPVLIGNSGSGRKGTAIRLGVRDLLELVDPDFAQSRIVSGLSSAEGLIAEVRDPVPDREANGRPVPGDPGVTDKRLLVIEGELGGSLEAMSREGNRLSAVVRDLWDGQSVGSLVKNNPQRATEPHVLIAGAITSTELRKLLSKSAVLNGFANRLLPIHGNRARLLAEDSSPDQSALQAVGRRIAHSVTSARRVGHVAWSPAAATMWASMYEELAITENASEAIRALLERAAPYTRRIAFLLALLDGSGRVDVPHLTAARKLWDYAAATWRFVYFDGSMFTDLAERLLAGLAEAGADGLSKTEIRERVIRSNAVDAERINAAIAELVQAGLAVCEVESTSGRSRERWRHARYVGASSAVGADVSERGQEKWEIREKSPEPENFSPMRSARSFGDTVDDGYWKSLEAEAAA